MTTNNSVCTKKSKPTEKSNEEPARPRNVVEKKIVKSCAKRIWIENLILFEKKITKTHEVTEIKDTESGKSERTRKLLDRQEKIKEYHLKPVDKSDLADLRNSKKPIFIVKDNDKYYYTKIHYTMSFCGILDVEHKCAPRAGVCKRLSPNSDECSGCAKVRARNPHIENYDWIPKAYEAVNNKYEAFIVLECKYHQLEIEPSENDGVKEEKSESLRKEKAKKRGNADLYEERNWNWFPELYL